MQVKFGGRGDLQAPVTTGNGLSCRLIAGLAVGGGALLVCGGLLFAAMNMRSQAHEDPFHLGGEVVLDTGADQVLLTSDRAAWKEYNSCVAENDAAGLLNMGLSGKTFSVERGTRAKIIDRGRLALHVRITAGDQVHKAGWIAREFVKLAESDGKE